MTVHTSFLIRLLLSLRAPHNLVYTFTFITVTKIHIRKAHSKMVIFLYPVSVSNNYC